MSAAEESAGDGGSPADPCPAARQLEEALPGGTGSKRARAECAREYVKCGRRHGEAGRLGAAGRCFKRAAKLHGMWAACADECGRIAARLEAGGRLADAVVWYGKAVKCTRRAPRTSGRKGQDTRRKRWASRCIKCWDALAGGAPPPASVGVSRPYRAAAAADPSRAATHVRMGDIEQGRGRYGRAAACYDRALRLDARNAAAALGAGASHEGGQRWARAVARYRGAARIDPRLRGECAAGCARCARALWADGDPGAAASAFEVAAGLDPSHALECARSLDRMGMRDEALAAFEAAAGLDHSHALECARVHKRRPPGWRGGSESRQKTAGERAARRGRSRTIGRRSGGTGTRQGLGMAAGAPRLARGASSAPGRWTAWGCATRRSPRSRRPPGWTTRTRSSAPACTRGGRRAGAGAAKVGKRRPGSGPRGGGGPAL